jgi:hypothetical protein
MNSIIPQERVKHLFYLWSKDLKDAQSDFEMRKVLKVAFLKSLDVPLEQVWNYSYPAKELESNRNGLENDEEVRVITLVCERCLDMLCQNLLPEDSKTDPSARTTQVEHANDMLALVQNTAGVFEKSLSRESKAYLEQCIIHHLPSFGSDDYKAAKIEEQRLLAWIETMGLFKDVAQENSLKLAESAVKYKATEILSWLFKQGLSPDLRVEVETRYGQAADSWPLASLSPTMDVLNTFIAHGADLSQSSEKGAPFSEILTKRMSAWGYSFTTPKDREQILRAVLKVEATTQKNPQKHLWHLLKTAQRAADAASAVRSVSGADDLRDEKGRHVVQFAMTQKPDLVNAILSINKKTLALASTPDENGNVPSTYWIASGRAQKIAKTQQTELLEPQSIDGDEWWAAANLAHRMGYSKLGVLSNSVQKKFSNLPGQRLGGWLEEEAVAGRDWFEKVLSTMDALVDKGSKSTFELSNTYPGGMENKEDSAIFHWADPKNATVVNDNHAIFRAQLVLARWMQENPYGFPFRTYGKTEESELKKAEEIKGFLKKHLLGERFERLNLALQRGASLTDPSKTKDLMGTAWWKETCAALEREGLMKKHVKTIKKSAPEFFTDAL